MAKTYTTAQAAEILDVDPGYIRQKRIEGRIKATGDAPPWVFTMREISKLRGLKLGRPGKEK